MMRLRLILAAALATFLSAGATPSLACSVIIPEDWGSNEFRKMAGDHVKRATAIIDGEVVRPFVRGRQTALVRAERVLKGPPRLYFEVGEAAPNDSCAFVLEQEGERLRLILSGGPDVYHTSIDQSLARYEDRILRSDRRKAWPYRPGPGPRGE
ncbi:MAG: hypothetical protein ABWX67_06775 [Allosphingosinicella sp.]